MRRLRIVDAAPLRIALREAMRCSEQARYLHRLHCVLCVAAGASCQEVAGLYAEDARSVERWVHRVNEHGAAGLRERRGRGRPAGLGPRAVEALRGDLAASPRRQGYAAGAWTGRLLVGHLRARYGVRYSTRHCQRLLRRLRPAAARGPRPVGR